MQMSAASVFSEISVHMVLLLPHPEERGCPRAWALREASELPGPGGRPPRRWGRLTADSWTVVQQCRQASLGGFYWSVSLCSVLQIPPERLLGDRGQTLNVSEAPHLGPQSSCPPSQLLSLHNRNSLMPKKDEVTEPPSRAHPPPLWTGPRGAS